MTFKNLYLMMSRVSMAAPMKNRESRTRLLTSTILWIHEIYTHLVVGYWHAHEDLGGINDTHMEGPMSMNIQLFP